jgi:hypothetical protein
MPITYKTIKIEKQTPEYFTCDGAGCGTSMRAVFGGPSNGMILKLEGGYGCAEEDIFPDFVLCKPCFEKLKTLIPAITTQIEEWDLDYWPDEPSN